MKATLALTWLLLSAGWLQAQVRLTDTLNKGILEEESQHNLAAAVADYQQVVAAFDEERKTAATALFRLAECQRKLHHDDQAKAVYERIVREFADQGSVVEQSRTILGATYKVKATQAAPFVVAIDPQAEEARKRYRSALKESLALAQSNLERMEGQVRLGAVGPEAVDVAEERILKLQRDLAAFDMGIMPNK
jgi:tetratricopeptide (TPR) repeat protein